MEKTPVLRHPLEHRHLAGDTNEADGDIRASHRINAMHAPRVVDELVTRETADGRKLHGEVFAIITPDHESADSSPHHPIDQYDSLCLVRYPDTKEVGIASRAARPDGTIYMHPGMILRPDERIYFGRGTKGEQADTEQTILGREALTGVAGVEFGKGVSRIHGSIDFYDGEVTITDGREELGEGRRVIDRASTNHTRVSVAKNVNEPRIDLLGQQRERDREEREKARFAEVFGAPKLVERDQFGNKRDRLSGMSQETIQDAEKTMVAIREPAIKAVIEEELSKLGIRFGAEEAVKAVRTNTELRIKLAETILNRLHEIRWQLPERLQSDRHSKNPNHPGYSSHMNNLEYAALIAISMLDGTFITKRSQSDKAEIISNSSGTQMNGGQHRTAALMALDLSAGAPRHIDTLRTYK